jgi:hypothetical protein
LYCPGCLATLPIRFLHTYDKLYLTLLNFAHYFLTGFLLADLYLTGKLRRSDKHLSWDAVTLLAAAAIIAVLTRFGHFYFLLPLLVGLLYAGFFLGRLSNAFVRVRWIVIIGGMCYTMLFISAEKPFMRLSLSPRPAKELEAAPAPAGD